MRILVLHNHYLHPGGEDTAFESEVALLRAHGHEVNELVETNRRIADSSRLSVALGTVWSWRSYRAVAAEIRRTRPDIVHSHNFFPLISPAAYYACRAAGVPVVQSLYNPRLVCPAATLYRNGRVCTDCVGRLPWPGVVHACYRGSRAQTLVVATMLAVHRWMGTWDNLVSRYLVATKFYKDLMVSGGLPGHKFVVKPNFVASDPGYEHGRAQGGYALFVGRFDPEKGIRTLLAAWRNLGIPLILRGAGRLGREVEDTIRRRGLDGIQIVPRMPKDALIDLMKGARFLVWPSEGFYETFGLVAVECFAAGVPVLASGIGVMQEIVRDGDTGLHFSPGDPADLAAKATWLWEHPKESLEMGANARREYEEKYTPERNYRMLMDIYSSVVSG